MTNEELEKEIGETRQLIWRLSEALRYLSEGCILLDKKDSELADSIEKLKAEIEELKKRTNIDCSIPIIQNR
jgi:hypothetical protein